MAKDKEEIKMDKPNVKKYKLVKSLYLNDQHVSTGTLVEFDTKTAERYLHFGFIEEEK